MPSDYSTSSSLKDPLECRKISLNTRVTAALLPLRTNKCAEHYQPYLPWYLHPSLPPPTHSFIHFRTISPQRVLQN